MTRVTLRRLIGRQSDARALVDTIVEALGAPVAVEDAEGRLLHGEASTNGASRYPSCTTAQASGGCRRRIAQPPLPRCSAI